MSADNFAILFSGGGDPSNNNSRYYDSTIATYEALIDRGVDPKNISIAFASGVDASGFSPNHDTSLYQAVLGEVEEGKVQSDHLEEKSFRLLRQILGLLERRGGQYSFGLDIWRDDLDPLLKSFQQSAEDEGLAFDFSPRMDADDPSRVLFNFRLFEKSDFREVVNNGSSVVSGTRESLQAVIDQRSKQIDSEDSLFVWTFDHGGIDYTRAYDITAGGEWGTYDDQGLNLANLTVWGNNHIWSKEFVDMFDGIVGQSRSTAFALAQCFSGGLLQGLLDDSELRESKSWFGLAAANQREVSWGSGFADEVVKALRNPSVHTGRQLWDAVRTSESYIFRSPSPYKPNQGDLEYRINDGEIQGAFEHPWSTYEMNGNDVSLFADEASRSPWDKLGIQYIDDYASLIGVADLSLSVSIPEDSSFDIVDALREEFGDFGGFVVSAVGAAEYGSIERPSSAQAEILNYIPQTDFYGEDHFRISASFDGGFVADIDVSVEVVPVNDAPLVVDDEFYVPVGAKDFLIDIDDAPGFLDDTDAESDDLAVIDYSQAEHGVVEKIGDELFRYTPDSGFVGVDSFLYVISDGEDSSVAEVFLGVGIDPSNRISNTLSNTFG